MVKQWLKHGGNRAEAGRDPVGPREGPRSESSPEFRRESNLIVARKGRCMQNQAKQSKTKNTKQIRAKLSETYQKEHPQNSIKQS